MITISNNCWGSHIFEKAKGTEYETPFIGVFLVAGDFVKMLENFDHYMSLTPTYTHQSKHYKTPKKYPILLLDDVEVHCCHDKKGPEDSIEKWCRRRDRMSLDKSNMIVKLCDRDKFNADIGKRFLALDQFPDKRLFVSQKWKDHFDEDNVIITEDKTRCPIGTTLEKKYPVNDHHLEKD